jgi:hypothetical protein
MIVLALLTTTTLAGPASGRFERAQPAAEVERICATAVDEAASQLSWVIRPLARPRLTGLATACPTYTFDLQGDAFRVQCAGKPAFDWTVGKTGPWTTAEGETVTVSLARRDDALILDFAGKDGGKAFTYRFGPAGDLSVTQRVYSSHLVTPMQWTLAYRRAD